MKKKILKNLIEMARGRDSYPTQQEIANYLKRYFPEEEGNEKLFNDRWGLYSDNPSGEVKKILLVTTPTQKNIDYAAENGFDIVISHHDFLINKTKVPQIIYHSTMDLAEKGHNQHFIRRLGLKDVKMYHKVVVSGKLYKPMTLDEFKEFLVSRGFDIDGMVWQSGDGTEKIEKVVYCSGGGGYLLGPNHIFDVTKITDADVYVTGELSRNPSSTPNNFKYIIELGHTISEKPLFKWIRLRLLNRWKNLEIEVADKSIDYLGTEKYQDRNSLWDTSRRYVDDNDDDFDVPSYYTGTDDFDDDLSDIEFIHQVTLSFIDFLEGETDISEADVDYIHNLIYDYYNDPEDRGFTYNEILELISKYDQELAIYLDDNLDAYLPDYNWGNLNEARLKKSIKPRWTEIQPDKDGVIHLDTPELALQALKDGVELMVRGYGEPHDCYDEDEIETLTYEQIAELPECFTGTYLNDFNDEGEATDDEILRNIESYYDYQIWS